MPSEKDILEFNQYMKSDKQKKVSIFLVDIQCQQFKHFIAKKTNTILIAKKIV